MKDVYGKMEYFLYGRLGYKGMHSLPIGHERMFASVQTPGNILVLTVFFVMWSLRRIGCISNETYIGTLICLATAYLMIELALYRHRNATITDVKSK
jgi:hypothetical protein